MTLDGGCGDDSFLGCYMSLAVVRGPARAARGILVTMVVILLAILIRIFMLVKRMGGERGSKRQSGWRSWALLPTKGNPTSILGTVILLAGENSRKTRELFAAVGAKEEDIDEEGSNGNSDRVIADREMKRYMSGFKFAMNIGGEVVVVDQKPQNDTAAKGRIVETALRKRSVKSLWRRYCPDFNSRHTHARKVLLEHGLNSLFLAVLGSLSFIITYYGSATLGWNNPLERFMDSQTIGVSFLFVSAGGIIDLFWGGFFSRKSPFPLMGVSCTLYPLY